MRFFEYFCIIRVIRPFVPFVINEFRSEQSMELL
jgi:hypothetical protein